jgi:hypothetical protein
MVLGIRSNDINVALMLVERHRCGADVVSTVVSSGLIQGRAKAVGWMA